MLESGARVPADPRLTATTSLQVDESALTGESVPAVKGVAALHEATGLADRTNLAYAGTTVTSGRGRGYVIGTGRQTEDGLRLQGDPTGAALLIAASRIGLEPDEEREAYRVVAEVPFEPERQFSAGVREREGRRYLFLKGAPVRVLAMCDTLLTRDGAVSLDHDLVQNAAHDMAIEGLRVLAMAFRTFSDTAVDPDGLESPRGLSLLGLQGMADPPRAGARDAIAACRDAGMRVVMITGDHAATARAIGRELGIARDDSPVMTGAEVETIDDALLRGRVRDVDVYARVAPEHKLRIVRALQANGDVVAVTGDGVNDAPALKAADIGIAMGKRGTDVAKESADMVLADDNFVSIAAAVEVLAIVIALALDWPLPLIAVQILWLNLVTDSLQVMALAFEPAEPAVMVRLPRGRNAGMFSRVIWERVAVTSVVMTAGTLALFRWELDRSGSERIAQTAALTVMVLFQMFQALNARSPSRSLLRMPLFSNPVLVLAIVASIAVHVAALYASPTQRLLRVEPIDLGIWLRAALVAATVLVAAELHKLVRRAT